MSTEGRLHGRVEGMEEKSEASALVLDVVLTPNHHVILSHPAVLVHLIYLCKITLTLPILYSWQYGLLVK